MIKEQTQGRFGPRDSRLTAKLTPTLGLKFESTIIGIRKHTIPPTKSQILHGLTSSAECKTE